MEKFNIQPAPHGFHRFSQATVVVNGQIHRLADRVWFRQDGGFTLGFPNRSAIRFMNGNTIEAVLNSNWDKVPNHVLYL